MTTFLDVVRKAAQRKHRGLVIKGGKGSGWYAPPKGTHRTEAKTRKKTGQRMAMTRTIKDERELKDTLCSLSLKHGGAWVFSIKPFSHEVHFERFQNPSSVPDFYHDLTQNMMAFQGKIRGFTEAARRRERNRGLGRV